jgi:hypothetical protein
MVPDSYCSIWGCKGRFFASQNGVGWCLINFWSSTPRSTSSPKCQGHLLSRWIVCMWFLTLMGFVLVAKQVNGSRMQMPINSSLTLKPRLKDFLTSKFSSNFIFGLQHDVTTLTNIWMKYIYIYIYNFGSFKGFWTRIMLEKWSFSCR